jgi:hypothetical protein
MAGHNELFHEECDWERRYKKRKCRLISCTEEIFAQVQAIEGATRGGIKGSQSNQPQIVWIPFFDFFHKQFPQVEPMDPQMASKAVLSSIAKQLNRFLRFARLDHFHQHADVQAHLQRCLDYGFSARTFLQRFFSNMVDNRVIFPSFPHTFHHSISHLGCPCRVKVVNPL